MQQSGYVHEDDDVHIGDENFTSLLCYPDDLMVFAPTEDTALQRLQMVFSRLKEHNLKLAPKKCFFLRRTVKFFGHVIGEDGVRTDPEKVRAINDLQFADLMESDGKTPCPNKIRSFLGMVMYYQSFIEACSAKAKPLLLCSAQAQERSQTCEERSCEADACCMVRRIAERV